MEDESTVLDPFKGVPTFQSLFSISRGRQPYPLTVSHRVSAAFLRAETCETSETSVKHLLQFDPENQLLERLNPQGRDSFYGLPNVFRQC